MVIEHLKTWVCVWLGLTLLALVDCAQAATMCTDASTTASSGTLYDSGGPSGDYGNNENCSFLIQPSGGGTITLSFSDFELQNADQLRVYNGTNASAPLLATLTGSSLPANVVANSGAMYLVFTSNPGGTRDGFAASWSTAAPAATLIAHYQFDVCDWAATGIAEDSVGSNDGVASGAVGRNGDPTSGIKPETCSSAAFGGGTIDINGLGVSTASGAKTSVSFWMYWDGGNSQMPIGWFRHDLWLVSGNFGFNTAASDVYGISSSGLANGWHHITAVFTNNNVTANKLYVDGVQQSLSQRQGSPNNSNAVVDSHLRISGWWSNDSYRFGGRIDEVKVYNGEVTQAQVNADLAYTASSCPTCTPPSGTATLIADYNFDDNWPSSGSLTDSVGGYHGALTGSVSQLLSPASGNKPDTCYSGSFNGGAFDVNGLPVSTVYNAQTSVSFWMYWDGTNSVMPMGWQYHDLWLYNGDFGFNSGNGDIFGISSAGLASGWHHVAVVFHNNNPTANQMYIDGVSQTLTQRRSSPNNSNAKVDPHLRIGGWWGNNSYRFRGQLDEFRVYTGAISQAQVLSDMNRACLEPAGWWKMDEAAWTGAAGEVKDASGNNLDGTSFNGLINDITTPAKPGNPGTCRYGVFDGTDDYIEIPHNNALNGSGELTYLAWVNADQWNGVRQVMAKSVHGGGSGRAQMGIFSEGNVLKGRAETSSGRFEVNTSLPATGSWAFLALTFSGSELRLYVNGASAASLSFPATTLVQTTDPLNISKRVGTNQYFFDGLIDEVRVYTRALSATQITQIMNATHPCARSPVAEWRFDESGWSGVGNEVVDSSGSNYHGTAVNVDTVPGLLCNAADLSANSDSDYLSMNHQAMNGLEDFTLVVWAKTASLSNFQTLVSGAAGSSAEQANELVMLFDTASRFTPVISQEFFNDTGDISLSATVNDDAWHQFVWTRAAASRQSCFYVDGALQGCVTHPNSNDADPLSILAGGLILGQDQDNLGGGFDSGQDWEGLMDEVMVFNTVLDATEIQAGRANILAGKNWGGTVRSCSSVDHYAISYPLGTPGLTCEAQTVRITAHDASDNPVAPSNSTQITFSTVPAADGWALKTGGGSFVAGPGAGQGRYTFDGTETYVDLYLTETTATPAININLSDGSASEKTSEDPSVAFVDAAFRFYSGLPGLEAPEAIVTQISGKSSLVAPGAQPIYLRAVQTNTSTGACEAGITGNNVPVEMAFACNSPSTCKTNDGVVISAAETKAIADNPNAGVSDYTSVAMNFDASGIAQLSLNYLDAGRISLHARKVVSATPPDPGFTLSGASNAFVVKPAGLCIEATAAASACTPASASCSVFTRAGEDFDMRLRAVTWESAGDTDFCSGAGGTNATTPNFQLANIGLSSTRILPISGANASLGVGVLDVDAADNGDKTISNQSLSEVGVFTLTATPPAYLGETLAASTSRNIGRITPYDFAVSYNTPELQTACGTFGYIGQPFNYVTAPRITVTARNKAHATTQNYQGDFFKLTQGSLTIPIGTQGDTGYRIAGHSLATGNIPVKPTVTDNNDGTAWLDFSFTSPGASVVRGAQEAPFDAEISLEINVIDSDNVVYRDNAGVDQNPAKFGNASAGNGMAFDVSKAQRWGRMIVNNAYGPEVLDLDMTLQAEYFDGTQFLLNKEDSCSTFIKDNASLSNYTGDLAGVGTSVKAPTGLTSLINGRSPAMAPLLLQAPGAGNDGTVTLTLTVPTWLQFDFNGDATPEDPSGLATFGQYRGHDRVIYWRERFQ